MSRSHVAVFRPSWRPSVPQSRHSALPRSPLTPTGSGSHVQMTAAFTLSPLFHSPSLKISSAFLRRMLLSCLIYEATTRSCPVGPQPLSLLFTSPLAATGLPRTHLRGYHSLTSS